MTSATGHVLDQCGITFHTVLTRLGVDAMKVGAGFLPTCLSEHQTIHIDDGIRNAQDLMKALHKDLQLTDIDKVSVTNALR